MYRRADLSPMPPKLENNSEQVGPYKELDLSDRTLSPSEQSVRVGSIEPNSLITVALTPDQTVRIASLEGAIAARGDMKTGAIAFRQKNGIRQFVEDSSLVIIEDNPEFFKSLYLAPNLTSSAFRSETIHGVIREPTLFLAGPGSSAPYHWLHDALPKLLAAELAEQGFSKILIPDGAPSFVTESLELLGYSDRLVRVRPEERLQIQRLLIVENLVTKEGVVETLLEKLRNRLQIGAGAETGSDTDCSVYISRQGCASRSIELHDTFLSTIREAGFIEPYQFEEMSLRDQIRLASNMTQLVGAHGAGLFHALFMKGGTVVELFPIDQDTGKQTNSETSWDRILRAHARAGREVRMIGVECNIKRNHPPVKDDQSKDQSMFSIIPDISAIQSALDRVAHVSPNIWHRLRRER